MKKRLLSSLLGLCLLSMLAYADTVTLREGHPEQHVVVKGDTLWDISAMFLRDPWRWPQIWENNPQIANPHLIYPGDVINLVYVNGEPRLRVRRGPGADTVRITPEMRLSPVDNAIPAIPLEKINAFLSGSRIVQEGALDDAPYVLAGAQGHIITGAGDELFARGEFDEADSVYGVYRRGEVFRDPVTKEVLGISAQDIGGVKKLSTEMDIAKMQVNRSREEIRIEDRLLPHVERRVTATFVPSAPPGEMRGYITAVEGGVTQVGFMDIVIVNRGEREGLREGHVLAIDRHGEKVRDRKRREWVQLPDERAGLLMVFRTYEKMSYGIVLRATQPLKVLDKVHSPNVGSEAGLVGTARDRAKMEKEKAKAAKDSAVDEYNGVKDDRNSKRIYNRTANRSGS